MVNFLKGTLASSLAILLGLAVAIPQAGAVPMLRLSDGTTTFDITDNDVNDTNSALGQVGFSGILGDFNVVVTVGITKPFAGTDLLPIMDIVNMMMTSTTGGNLTISFTEDNFSGPLPSTIVQGFKAEIGGVTAGTVQYQTFLDAGNNKFF